MYIHNHLQTHKYTHTKQANFNIYRHKVNKKNFNTNQQSPRFNLYTQNHTHKQNKNDLNTYQHQITVKKPLIQTKQVQYSTFTQTINTHT